jgi:hypothetical protein
MRPYVVLLSVLSIVYFVLVGCGGSSASSNPIPTPSITSLSPTSVAPGGAFTIIGGALNGTSTTIFFAPTAGGTATQTAASSGTTASVIVTAPSTLTAGTYNVYVETLNPTLSDASNSVTLTVS